MKTPNLSGYWPEGTTDLDRIAYKWHLYCATPIWKISTKRKLFKAISEDLTRKP